MGVSTSTNNNKYSFRLLNRQLLFSLCGPLCLPYPAHTQLVLLPFPVPRRQRLLRFRFFLGGQNNLRFRRDETTDKVEIYINLLPTVPGGFVRLMDNNFLNIVTTVEKR